MATFTPNGRAHQILNLLTAGPVSRHEVMMTMAGTPREGRKVSYVLASLQTADLIKSIPPIKGYAITKEGEQALATLEMGRPVYAADAPPWSGPAVPNVRVFVREAGHA